MALCSSVIGPFDLECLFVNTFSGSVILFTFIALIFIVMMAGRMRMFAGALGVSLILFAILIMPIAPWVIPVFALFALTVLAVIIISTLGR